MEEILASIRRIIADDQDLVRGKPERRRPAPEDAVYAPPVATPKAEPLLREDEAPIESGPAELEDDPGPLAEEPRAAEPSPMPEPAPLPAQDRLISTATDASVGQAFHNLAHTVLTGNAHTLEDLVREMLRPMLKTWLDDNLPVIVERLVRAEIERVARGGR